MSGKSTLLRTVGTNTVLALAGAPVRASALTISPVALGTAMRFRDSIHKGASYFYAVLKRLRAVLDLAGQRRPLLFLFDEILQGTNSQDRLTGAEAVMRKLLDSGAIGLMTTHDLALTRIVDDLAPRAANMHCEDQLVDGQMTFDYKLRPGVVTKSNAIELMRSMGLDV
jgi:DNA mismatch repair ATPase MutS